MKRAISLLFFSWFFVTVAISQLPDISVKWIMEQDGSTGKDKEQSYEIGKDDKGGVYQLRERYQYVNGKVAKIRRYIEHFDVDGRLLGSEQFKIRHAEGDRFFDGIFFNEGRMYLVTYHLRRADKMNVLSVQDINPVTLLVNEHIKAIAEVPYERGLFGFVNTYSLKRVNDRIYVYHAGPEPVSGKIRMSIHVFDMDFNLQWKQFRTLPYQEKLFLAEDFKIDKNGTIRIMAAIYKDVKRKVRHGRPNYEYHFFVIGNRGEEFREHTVALGEKLITDMRFTYRPNGDIACAGFYSDNSRIGRPISIAGAFYITIDPKSSHVGLENYKAFDEEFLSHFMSTDAAERGKEAKNIRLHHLHFLEDGTAILLAEEYQEYQTQASIMTFSYSYGDTYYVQTTTTVTFKWMRYEFDNIVVMKVNPEGMIDWVNIIPKKQHTNADLGMYSSYTPAFVDDKIYLIYNDNPKNLTAAPGEVYRFRKNNEAVVVCAEIDYEGNVTKKALFSAREAETIICPRSCNPLIDNKMAIYGKKRRKVKWGILEFN